MLKNIRIFRPESGFTLVELAIVMIIIGLLIGGVLKGQELIRNAQLTATVAQVISITAATTTFKDMYNGLPGDLVNPSARIPGCPNAIPCTPGTPPDGNGRLSTVPIVAWQGSVGNNSENRAFFVQLAAAGLLTGINPDGGITFGGEAPSAKINSGGGFAIGSPSSPPVAGDFGLLTDAGIVPKDGLYLVLTGGTPDMYIQSFLTPNQAARIDARLDDGQPNTGTVRAFSSAGAACAATGAAGAYVESDANRRCSLHIRIQN